MENKKINSIAAKYNTKNAADPVKKNVPEPESQKSALIIKRVNDHGTSFRIKLNIGMNIEISKAEIGDFIPKNGMIVHIRLFNNVVLQEVRFDGILILKRTPQQMLDLLSELTVELQAENEAFQKFTALEESREYMELPIGFKHRIRFMKMMMKNDFTEAVMKKEIAICHTAYSMSGQKPAFIQTLSHDRANKIFRKASELSEEEFNLSKTLAYAWQQDKDWELRSSEVLLFTAASTPCGLRPSEAFNRYLAVAEFD